MALLSPTPTPFAPLELTVATSSRTEAQLSIDAGHMRWDEIEIDLDQVRAIAYAARPGGTGASSAVSPGPSSSGPATAHPSRSNSRAGP